MKRALNHPHLTAIKRTAISFPTRWVMEQGLLCGAVLDFGCGHGYDTDALLAQGFDIEGYDSFYRPNYPTKRYDTILCHYVLNVLEPEAQAEVLMAVSELLKPTGVAYFTVRRDLKSEGFRMHAIYKEQTYQCNVQLPYESVYRNAHCEIYAYRHYNRLPHAVADDCPFCGLSDQVELLSETATAMAFLDSYPVSEGHTLIVPKRHVASYFDLTIHEQRALWLLVNRCKKIANERYRPDGFNVGINVGEAAGQSVMHVHIHLIPRYNGDVEAPRGGVRGVIPGKRDY